jgi:hypothetical protein
VVVTTLGIQTIFNSFFISVLGLRGSGDVRAGAG